MSAAGRILIAPDSFKGTFEAERVCEAVAAGVEAAGLVADRCPVADGGEGTSEILRRALGGRRIETTATGPLGRSVRAGFAMVGEDAYIDLAEASGIGGLRREELDPVGATTAGTGELMLAARDAGARRIFVAAGGSATVDGGAGALAAIERGGGLGDIALTVLCDVEVPYESAPAVFGPQKGADTPELIGRLEERLAEFAAASLPVDPRGLPMSGAAGGFSGGLWAALGARLLPGAPFVLDRLDFDRRLAEVDAVIAGEGALDEQSFMGKILGEILGRAKTSGRPLHVVCGRSRLSADRVAATGLASVGEAGDLDALREAGRRIARAVAEYGDR